jgi:hypothetical protein
MTLIYLGIYENGTFLITSSEAKVNSVGGGMAGEGDIREHSLKITLDEGKLTETTFSG